MQLIWSMWLISVAGYLMIFIYGFRGIHVNNGDEYIYIFLGIWSIASTIAFTTILLIGD